MRSPEYQLQEKGFRAQEIAKTTGATKAASNVTQVVTGFPNPESLEHYEFSWHEVL